MIEIERLPKGRYLLGFSGGVDSSALFFLLLERGVEFDIAIVDYGLREQSKEEVAYAKKLAQDHQKLCFCTQAPKFTHNFESQAREFRYEFFSQILAQEKYDGVLLAHQLDDRFEWVMMQMCKGAGLDTLLGFDFVQNDRGYLIYRPLWKVPKSRLYEYCRDREIVYFEDISNAQTKYMRNAFRQYLQPLLLQYSKGIQRSLEYLLEDRKKLYEKCETTYFGDIACFQRREQKMDLYQLDFLLKKRGYLLSAKQRKEILKEKFSCEIAGKWIIESDDKRIYLCSKISNTMSKEFRDFARKLKIPKNLRQNIFCSHKAPQEIKDFFAKD